MRIRACWLVLAVLVSTSVGAQQTIYFKKDHIYNGPGGKEIAVITPVPLDQVAPAVPSNLTSSALTSTSVQLSWSASTDSGGSGLAGYKVYRQQGTGANLPVGTVGTGTLSFTDQPLQPNTGYSYTIVAFDNAQNHSAPSNTVIVTTLSVAVDTAAPTTPANVVASLAARNTVRLDWSASTDVGGSGVAGYRVYRNGTLISGANPIAGLSYQDAGLSYRTAYAYTVVAVDNAANASATSTATNITTDWELVFQDDFNRSDATNNSDLNSSHWSSSGWVLRNLAASVSRVATGSWTYPAQPTDVGVLNDLRMTLDFLDGPYDYKGFDFWTTAGFIPFYRIRWNTYGIELWYEWNYVPPNYQGSIVASGSVPSGIGTLRVEAISATRRIKVYVNNTLVIDYTETDTSRPNSGGVGFWQTIFGGATVRADRFLLER